MFTYSRIGLSRLLFTLALFQSAAVDAAEPIRPLPVKAIYDDGKAFLGKILFSDPVLSLDYSVACASCHDLNHGGADNRKVSLGVEHQTGNVQSPTVFNARFNFRQFWNGRVSTLHQQAVEPMHNPKEMHISESEILKRLNANPEYRDRFSKLYGNGPIRYPDVIDAIVEFEKALVTPNSRFDRYLRGETGLSELEEHGYRRFKERGCITCHNGVNIGANSYQKMGTINPYPHHDGVPDLHALNGRQEFRNVFKVPTLRNIALTAPYFHDASASTLSEAVRMMGYYNLGMELPKEEVRAIVAFLETLTGEKPEILSR